MTGVQTCALPDLAAGLTAGGLAAWGAAGVSHFVSGGVWTPVQK